MLRAPFVAFVLAGCALGPCAQEVRTTAPLHGTVTDERGAPVAGVTVELRRRLAQGCVCLDLPFSRETRRAQVLRTGKQGSFAAELPLGVPFELWLDDGVHAPIRRRAVYAGEQIDLQLVPAARVVVTLRDAAGKPVPGGTLESWDGSRLRWVDGRIDAEGTWRSDRLPVGTMTFDIAPASAMRPEWSTVELVAGETTPLELVLEPGCVLRGRVVDAATGLGIAGARIGEGWTMDKFVVTDVDGRYEMRGFGAPGYGEVRVTADGYGPELRRHEPDPAGVTLDFWLHRGVEVAGRIVDVEGRPVRGAYVAVVGGMFGGDGTFTWNSARTDADGRYSLRGVPTKFAHSLFVKADGHATLVADLPALKGERHELPDLAMRAPRYVTGVVVDARGEPVVGLDVALHGCNFDRGVVLGPAASAGSNPADYCIAVRTMKTDSLGRIHFADVPPGSYQLSLSRDDSGEQWAVEVEFGKDPAPIRIEY